MRARGNQYTTIYPKGISKNNRTNRFTAQYLNKDLNRTIYIGSYDTIEEAVNAREEHITKVYDGVIDDSKPKTKGLPKGICDRPNGTYIAGIQFWYGKYKDKIHKSHIGTFETIEEAVEARKNFILNLL